MSNSDESPEDFLMNNCEYENSMIEKQGNYTTEILTAG